MGDKQSKPQAIENKVDTNIEGVISFADDKIEPESYDKVEELKFNEPSSITDDKKGVNDGAGEVPALLGK